MNSLHLFGSFRPTSYLVIKRYLLSPKDRIKLLNFHSKSLYGPVIKKDKSKPKKPTIEHENVASTAETNVASSLKTPETNYGSEMYWIISNRWNEILFKSDPKNLKDSKVKKLLPVTSKLSTEESSSKAPVTSKKPTEKSSPNAKENSSEINLETSDKLIETKVIDTGTNGPTVVWRPILLSNEELKNILSHPLQTEVLAPPPTNIRSPEFRKVPSVGKILQYTMPENARSALLKWKLTKIKELGEKGFAELQKCKNTYQSKQSPSK